MAPDLGTIKALLPIVCVSSATVRGQRLLQSGEERASALLYIPFTGLTARMDATAAARLRSAKPPITIAHTGTWRHMRARRTASL
jgi:hypothetical protein